MFDGAHERERPREPHRLASLVERLGVVSDQVGEGGRSGVDLEPLRELACEVAAAVLPPWRHEAYALWSHGCSDSEIARSLGKSRTTVRDALYDRKHRGQVVRGAISLVADELRKRAEVIEMGKPKPDEPTPRARAAEWYRHLCSPPRPQDVIAFALLSVIEANADQRGEMLMADLLPRFPRQALSFGLDRLKHLGHATTDGRVVRIVKAHQPVIAGS